MIAVVRPPVRWRFSAFDPPSFVAFPNYPCDLPAHKWLKCIPLFAGKSGELVEDHLASFSKSLDVFQVEHENVVMRMFVSTLEGEARTCYKSLLDASIDGWDSFQEKFVERWADKSNNFSLINAFDSVKKNGDDIVIDFNARFFKTYCKIPTTIRHNVAYALNYYLEAFDGIFGIFPKHKEPQNLEEAQVVAIKLEGHFISTYGFILVHEFQLPIVKAMQEVLVTKDEPQLAPCQVPKDKQDNHGSGLDDLKPIATPFESNAEFQEDEDEYLNTQGCSLVPSMSDDKQSHSRVFIGSFQE
jgi:hypothetical protein